MDASGTLNTADELKQLTTNVLFKLSHQDPNRKIYSPDEVKEKLDSIGELDDSNAWSPQVYIEWFHREFDSAEEAVMSQV